MCKIIDTSIFKGNSNKWRCCQQNIGLQHVIIHTYVGFWWQSSIHSAYLLLKEMWQIMFKNPYKITYRSDADNSFLFYLLILCCCVSWIQTFTLFERVKQYMYDFITCSDWIGMSNIYWLSYITILRKQHVFSKLNMLTNVTNSF